MKTCSSRRVAGGLSIIALLTIGLPLLRASAQPANEPLDDQVVVDGMVIALAKTNQVLYLGGQFTAAARRVGGGAPVSIATGQVESNFPQINGSVNVAIPDGQGGWFVGGSFTKVGGLTRSNVVRIRSDRTVDPNWRVGVGDSVQSLVLSGNTLFMGGSFTNVEGAVRNHLAAVEANTGAMLGWNPDVSGKVNAIAEYKGNIFVGGAFSTIGGQTRPNLGAIDGNTGQPTPWSATSGLGVGANAEVLALQISNDRLFVGGYFTSLAGQGRSRLGSFDLSSGSLDSWNPNVGSVTIMQPTIFAMAVHDNVIFVGGTFTLIGDRVIVNLAAVDVSSGLATSWDPRADPVISSGLPTALVTALSVFNNTLYVGGALGTIGGQPRSYAAALDLTTGDATDWDPRPNLNVVSFCGNGDAIYLGGLFSGLNTEPRTNAAAFDLAAHRITEWNPSPIGASGNSYSVAALLLRGNQLLIGGTFTNVAGAQRINLAAVDLINGIATDWSPNPNFSVAAMAAWKDRLYVGGSFTNISGSGRVNLAEFDLNDGALTSFDAGLNRSLVQALAVSGDTLYAGGIFRTAGGLPHRAFAAFDLNTGTVSAWDPGFSGSVNSLIVQGTRLYACGMFTKVGGLSRTNYVGIDTATGELLPAADTDGFVYSLAATSNRVIVAGSFSTIAGQKRTNLAAIDPATGEVANWSPVTDLFVKTVQILDGTLYAEGAFLKCGGVSARGLAAFPMASPPSSSITITPESFAVLGDGTVQFSFSANGLQQGTVQASTDLTHWQDLMPVSTVNGSGFFSENRIQPLRFYRIKTP